MLQKMKCFIKKNLAWIVYKMHRGGLLPNKIQVHSVDETLDELLNTEKSMIRFGDSDIVMISGKNTIFQDAHTEISEGLKHVIQSEYEGLMIALPDTFGDLGIYVPSSQTFWQDHLLFFRKVYYKYCHSDRVYYNSFVSRGYMIYMDKSNSERWFEKFRRVFEGRMVVMVEGNTAHNGVGNDLFGKAKSVERIVCPSRDAYQVRDRILRECLKYEKDKLFLIALGVTAKALAEELFLNGYRVLDIGNLDMEYEWFIQQAKGKVPLPKHQVIGEEANRAAGYEEYLAQVKCVIEG